MNNPLDILKNTLIGFDEIKQSGDEFTACFHAECRVLSYIEENKCIDTIKKAGGEDVKTLDRMVGVSKFKFKWIEPDTSDDVL